jgi:peptidoglycan/xylan/chitin deacetylase (PgdA/CDA1 family)
MRLRLARCGLVAAGAAATLAHASPAPAPLSVHARTALGIRGTVEHERAVGLSFDDGPHPKGTGAVLERLAEGRARATFFLVGEQVERRPGLAAEIVAAGHEVALHGHTHRCHLRLLPGEAREDVRRGAAALAEATGRPPRLHRPPFGLYSTATLRFVRDVGLEPVLWSRHGRDWSRRATPRSIARRLGTEVRAGEILLLHDADHYAADGSWRRTVAALPWLLEDLERARLDAVPV